MVFGAWVNCFSEMDVEPLSYGIALVRKAKLISLHGDSPKPVIFLQFQPAAWLLMRSMWDPTVIFLVFMLMEFIWAHQCSGSSRSDCSEKWRKLRLKQRWHLRLWLWRGNLRITYLTFFNKDFGATCMESGSWLTQHLRFLDHWQQMSYDRVRYEMRSTK